jgi:thiamine biosynthesis protein ThiS
LTGQKAEGEIEVVMNGLREKVPAGTTIAGLIAMQKEEGADLIVERNNRFVFPQSYGSTVLEDGDRIEFIHADFGG